ncbi:ABC transporter permease [Bacteroides sp.]|uniref:ABC transporter permease n=1 Tax=Bacteroides sp. TaxID=29523 RepID=UPI00260FDD86|nr:ABC transporter permease [Bacteroides sp.]MDD3038577.1 ABC transporter permease [Bacteroides sp.]
MGNLILLKLIFRSWWRNKHFAVISLVSLIVGISCTNLLLSFVIHEYTIEGENPNKDRIFRLTQQLPFMQDTREGAFVYGGVVKYVVAPFPEIESYLRLSETRPAHIEIGDQKFQEQVIVKADSSFGRFFPYQILSGNLTDALTKPDCVALSEEKAMQFFGKTDCVGSELSVVFLDKVDIRKVAAVYKPYVQAAQQIDILSNSSDMDNEGTSCMILLKERTDQNAFLKRFESTELPALMGEGFYQLQTLQESYFNTDMSDPASTFHHRQEVLLSIGLLSAFLILLIACFNYVNLSFSRLLKQVNMIHIESLLGASHSYICRQLFVDTFLTVFIAFMFSILVIGDILPLFNYSFSSHLTLSFILSWKVFPWIFLFVLVLAIVPAVFMAKKLNRISISRYRQFFLGKGKRRLIAVFVCFQLVISIGLITAFTMIHTQLSNIENQGERYKGVVILGNEHLVPSIPLYNDIKNLPGIQMAVLTENSISSPVSIGTPLNTGNGKEPLIMKVIFKGSREILDLLKLDLIEPERTADLLLKTAYPVVVNQAFIRTFISEGEDPVGQVLSKYGQDNAREGTIVGIFEDFRLTTHNTLITPMEIVINEPTVDQSSYISCRIDENKRGEVLKQLQQLWNKYYPEQSFIYTDAYQRYLSYNKDMANFSHLLLAYALISLFLTLFGVFGITWYAVEQRRREIAIRKVYGATSWQILLLLSRSFFYYILAAYVVAIPVVYVLMNKWREQFVYPSDWGIGVFTIPVILLMLVTFITVILNGYHVALSNNQNE